MKNNFIAIVFALATVVMVSFFASNQQKTEPELNQSKIYVPLVEQKRFVCERICCDESGGAYTNGCNWTGCGTQSCSEEFDIYFGCMRDCIDPPYGPPAT